MGRLIHFGGPKEPAVEVVGVAGATPQSNNVLAIRRTARRFARRLRAGDAVRRCVRARPHLVPAELDRADKRTVPIVPAMRQALRDTDPRLIFNKFRTIEDVRSETMATPRVLAWLLGALAGIAVILCVVGVYGLVANTVAERRRELGVRIALGRRRTTRSRRRRPAASASPWPEPSSACCCRCPRRA